MVWIRNGLVMRVIRNYTVIYFTISYIQQNTNTHKNAGLQSKPAYQCLNGHKFT